MKNDDLTRVRRDLDAMESALALPTQPHPSECRMYLLFAAAGLVAIVWSLLPHGLPATLGFCAFILPVALWLGFARTQANNKERRGALRTLWLVLPIMALFVWCRVMDLSQLVFLGLTTFLVGALLFSAAVGERNTNSLFGWALALMIGGLVLPLQPAPPSAVLAGVLASGGMISAVLLYITRERSSNHASS
jgi:hypothetical protein